MTPIELALEYAAQGTPVFPCLPQNKRPCVPKKEGGNGYKDATTEEAQIRKWWTRWPKAMVGMPTGSKSGVMVFDVDVKEGVDGFAAMWAETTRGRVTTREPGVRGNRKPRSLKSTSTPERARRRPVQCRAVASQRIQRSLHTGEPEPLIALVDVIERPAKLAEAKRIADQVGCKAIPITSGAPLDWASISSN
jgi:hypothetical protein